MNILVKKQQTKKCRPNLKMSVTLEKFGKQFNFFEKLKSIHQNFAQ